MFSYFESNFIENSYGKVIFQNLVMWLFSHTENSFLAAILK